MKTTDKTDPELFPETPRNWFVAPRFKPQTRAQKKAEHEPELSHYELRFGAIRQAHLKRTTESGRVYLQSLANFMNDKGQKPRLKIECAADAPNPEAYLQRISDAPRVL